MTKSEQSKAGHERNESHTAKQRAPARGHPYMELAPARSLASKKHRTQIPVANEPKTHGYTDVETQAARPSFERSSTYSLRLFVSPMKVTCGTNREDAPAASAG